MAEGIAIHSQTTVVSIEATSQSGKDGVDTARVSTSIIASSEDDARALAGSFEGQVEQVGSHVSVTQTIEIPGDDDTFRFSLTVPSSGAGLVKHGEASLLILLPRDQLRDGAPRYRVLLDDYQRDPAPTLHDGHARPRIGERIGLSWHERADPEGIAVYIYDKLSGSNR